MSLQFATMSTLVLTALIGWATLCSADITDMTGEAICAAQCFANFSQSCLEVCRWPRGNDSNCEASCTELSASLTEVLPNSDIAEHRRTCLDACAFSHNSHQQRASVVSGLQPASCPLPSSWPQGPGACLPQQRCTTDADCLGHHPAHVVKCCRADVCITERGTGGSSDSSSGSSPHQLPMLYRLARGRMASQGVPTGMCMQINNDTVFGHKGVPPVPGRPTVRQTAMIPGDQEVYQLELDWSEYYNSTKSEDNLEWVFPAVFLIQVRLFREVGGSIFGDQGEFGDDILQEELFNDWKSLVWTTKTGAVLSELNPGTWYQFRLKAASGAGFGGNGRPSRPIRVMTLPEPPRNLTEGPSRIYANKVEVKLHWERPLYGAIKFYRVSWKKDVPVDRADTSQEDFEAKVPVSVYTYTMQDLEPGTVYRVQIMAVAVVDGKQWSSPPALKYIKTAYAPAKELPYGVSTPYSNADGRRCRCGNSAENRYFFQPAYFEDGKLKTQLRIPQIFVAQYFGVYEKEMAIFNVLWYPHVCIETQNTETDLHVNPTSIDVYAAALDGITLSDLRFQCHYKLRIQKAGDPLPDSHKRILDLCFCTPSCKEVPVASGHGPRNCSFADVLVPHRPVDVGYRLFPIETSQRHPLLTDVSMASSQGETETVFPVRNSFKTDSVRQPGFDAIIFWKSHPSMISSGSPGRYTKYADSRADRVASNSQLLLRGYRVIWGPRLIEPIEPDMYNNGIAPQLDPERTESKVVDSKVHNVVLRNLEPDTLYIVQVQTIGTHGDSPVNAVFFTTPRIRREPGFGSSGRLDRAWALLLLSLLCLIGR